MVTDGLHDLSLLGSSPGERDPLASLDSDHRSWSRWLYGRHGARGFRVRINVGPAVFSIAGNQRVILGQTGFFAFFTMAFRYGKREMDIRRARS